MTDFSKEDFIELDPKVAYSRLVVDTGGAYSMIRFKGCEQILIPKSGVIAVTELMSRVLTTFDGQPIASVGSVSHYDRGQCIVRVNFEHGESDDNVATLALLQNIIMTASCGRTALKA